MEAANCLVAVARCAVVRRDGRVQAAGHPADHARLGLAEDRLDELAGTAGVIDQIAGAAELIGKVNGKARRAMTAALAIRFTLLMTLMPEADYPAVMDALLGDLVLVPWQRPRAAPTATVASTWREALGPEPLEELRDMVLAGVGAEHREHDYRAVRAGDLDVGSIDGSLTRVPDTPGNREAFGSAGTADDSSPYPQLRELRISDASTRAALAVVSGPSGAAASRTREKGEAEQKLLDRALDDYPAVFTRNRLWVMDRNFPGVARIQRMLGAGTHVLIRVKSDISLRPAGGFATRWLLPGGDLRRRHHPHRPGHRVLGHDRRAAGPRAVRPDHRPARPRRLPSRRPGRRLSLAVDRLGDLPEGSQVRDRRRRALRRADVPLRLPALIAQEHAAWVTSVELARAAARAAAAIAVPARKGKRAGQPVHPREISFTAARRAVITSARSGAATASLPTPAIKDGRERILKDLARRRIDVDRGRHRDRKTKARTAFPPGGPRIPSFTAEAEISICGQLAA